MEEDHHPRLSSPEIDRVITSIKNQIIPKLKATVNEIETIFAILFRSFGMLCIGYAYRGHLPLPIFDGHKKI
jgi:hypothetical protein